MLAILLCSAVAVSPADYWKGQEVFCSRVETIVRVGGQVTENTAERTDINVLRFHARELREAIDATNWRQAGRVKKDILASPSLKRSHAVALDAKRRLAERQRADEERRHREEMRQRQAMHEAEMAERQRQRSALEALYYRWQWGY